MTLIHFEEPTELVYKTSSGSIVYPKYEPHPVAEMEYLYAKCDNRNLIRRCLSTMIFLTKHNQTNVVSSVTITRFLIHLLMSTRN